MLFLIPRREENDEAADVGRHVSAGGGERLCGWVIEPRPSGSPNIVLDEAAGRMTAMIRLAVNEANGEAWKTAAHARFACDGSRLRYTEDFEVCRAALKVKWEISTQSGIRSAARYMIYYSP